jgi:heme-degrading monooxygenase HmoA
VPNAYPAGMNVDRPGAIAVIFLSTRTGLDEAGYAAANARMEALATEQPGYLGMESARGEDGLGVTISYWADDAAALSWRDHPEHAAVRDQGRGHWYSWYRTDVARLERSYEWRRPA